MLTKPQTALFWRTFQKACTAQQLGTSADRDVYRKTVMREECGVEHMSELGRTAGFDKVMLRLNLDAGDYQAAARFESGRERRMAHLVEVCAMQLMQLQGLAESEALAYVLGVIRQARFNCRLDGGVWWLDLIEEQLAALFDMLDTHRRRCLKAAGWDDGLKFSANVKYTRLSDGRVELIRIPIDEADLLIRVA